MDCAYSDESADSQEILKEKKTIVSTFQVNVLTNEKKTSWELRTYFVSEINAIHVTFNQTSLLVSLVLLLPIRETKKELLLLKLGYRWQNIDFFENLVENSYISRMKNSYKRKIVI